MALNTVTVTVDTVDYAFSADSVQQDAVRFNAPSATLSLPRTLTLRRVYPKKSGTYPGNARNNLKLSWMCTYDDGTTSPIIIDLSVSRRADTDSTEFAKARGIVGQMVMDAELDGFFTNLSL
jgi:hypothetical protein